MKEKMLRQLWLVVGLVVSLALVSCAPSAKKMDAEPAEAASESAIVSKSGLYHDRNLGVKLTWPAEVMSVNDPLQSATEVLRVRADNPNKIPVLVLGITDKTEDAAPITDVETVAGDFKDGLKESQKITNSKRFKLKESKLVTLPNGTQGVYSLVTWKYGGTFGLVTTSLTVYKGDKVITVSCTASPGNPPVEVMEKFVTAVVVDVDP